MNYNQLVKCAAEDKNAEWRDRSSSYVCTSAIQWNGLFSSVLLNIIYEIFVRPSLNILILLFNTKNKGGDMLWM